MTNNAQILVVEDDEEINGIICEFLNANGYFCTSAFSGTEGCMLLDRSNFDLIICDLMLPGLPGEEIVKVVKKHNTPLIVVSAKTDVSNKISLLELGANDYLTKPFDLHELKARIDVQLRNLQPGIPAGSKDIRIGAWLVSTMARTLTINGEEIALTKIEFNIIEALVMHPNQVYTRPELFEVAWNEPYNSDDNTVNAHISTLRSKLKPSHTDSYIRTVWGVGFKLVPEIED